MGPHAAPARGLERPIEVTLTNRETMLFRMLLGRTAIAGHALVDLDRSYLTGRQTVLARRYRRARDAFDGPGSRIPHGLPVEAGQPIEGIADPLVPTGGQRTQGGMIGAELEPVGEAKAVLGVDGHLEGGAHGDIGT